MSTYKHTCIAEGKSFRRIFKVVQKELLAGVSVSLPVVDGLDQQNQRKEETMGSISDYVKRMRR
jgi:hypothetical protein